VRSFFLYAIAVLFFCSCKKDVGRLNYGNYPAEIGKIISGNCATSGCHNGQSYMAASGLNLESWSALFKGGNSGSPVIPFSSKFSSLCYYINTFPELGLQNTPVMPLNKAPLSFEQVKTIKDWIEAGAADVDGNVMWGDNPQRKKLYAVNQGCDVVTVFDSETQLPIRFIEVGTKPGIEAPHMVRVSPDGKYWYVIFINNNIMQKFRCSDDSYVGQIPLMPLAAGTGTDNALDWNTFVISKDSKKAFVVSWTPNGVVSAVDIENMKFIKFTGGLNTPHAIALNAENTKIFVGAQTGNYITELDTGFTDSQQYSLDGGAVNSSSSLDIHDMVLSPNNKHLFITCQKSNEVRVFNVIDHMPVAVVQVGTYPQEIVYSATTNQYYVTCTYDNSGAVSKIDGGNYAVSKLPFGYQPHGIAVDEKKKLIYVLSRNVQSSGPAPHHTAQCSGRNGFVSFIDLNTFKPVGKKYEMSVDPYFISIRP
jgi:DNA-binding beta-propeller fold protein YncE